MPSFLVAFSAMLSINFAVGVDLRIRNSESQKNHHIPLQHEGVRINADGGLEPGDDVSALQVSALQVVRNQSSTERIPKQIILTGKWASLAEVPDAVGKNVRNTLSLNPELHVRWFGDAACGEYLKQHFDAELVDFFENERRGSFRGDLCRAAVLSREGGFYTDLDVEWKVPLRELVDGTTSFMSAYGENGELLNALMAVEPGSEIMGATLRALRKWYKLETPHKGWMGPVTLLQALRDVQRSACPEMDLTAHVLEKPCGTHKLRLYEQRELHCNQHLRSTDECPPSRTRSKFDGLQFGLFEPGSGGKLIGWPRFADCGDWGCGGGGWSLSQVAD